MSSNEKLERELDALLANDDSRTASLYRKLPQSEPDGSIDAAILAMARRHTKSTRNPKPYWLAGMAAAAVVVIAAGVVWRISPDHGARIAPAPSESSIDKSMPVTAPASPAARSIPRPMPATKSISEPAMLSKMKPESDEAAAPTPSGMQAASRPTAAAREPATPPESTKPAQRKTRAAPARTPEDADATTVKAPRQSSETPAYSEAVLRNSRLYPESWLAAIERLVRDGKRNEAAQNLELFRYQYPDYQLPADLKDFQVDSR